MNTKRILAILFAVLMLAALCACNSPAGGSEGGSNDGGGDKEQSTVENDGSSYGIDLNSEELQPMSEKRATVEKLKDTFDNYCKGLNRFDDLKNRTYQDFVDYIGCDATQYQLSGGRRFYIWLAEDNEFANFNVLFSDEGGSWRGYGVGTANLK